MMLAALPTVDMYAQLPILIVVISLVYAATRYDDWASILIEAVRWGGRMVLFLASIGVVLYLEAEFGVIVVWIGLALLGVMVVFYVVSFVIAPFFPKKAGK
jgi:hypothetical protein